MTALAEREPEPRAPGLGAVVMADDPCEAASSSADPFRPGKYYRARYYDPKIGRFISEDPISFFGGINFYAYVENNSVNLTDPFGLASAAAAAAPAMDPFKNIGQCIPFPQKVPPVTPVVPGMGTVASALAMVFLTPTTANRGADFDPGTPQVPSPNCTVCRPKQDTSPCDRLLELCLENPWQPPHKRKQWGPRKDCGACYRACINNGGAWPFDKCPIF